MFKKNKKLKEHVSAFIKKRKRKKKIKEIEKIWKKNRSLFLMTAYALFIGIIIILIKMGPGTPKVVFSKLDLLKKMDNYNYTYTIDYMKNGVRKTEQISGKRYKEKELLKYNENEYYFENNNLIGFPISMIDVTKLRSDYLHKYILASELVNNDQSIDWYNLELSDFLKIVNGIDAPTSEDINLVVISSDDEITQVDLNLTNYVNYNTDNYENYSISINYSNINKVNDFSK